MSVAPPRSRSRRKSPALISTARRSRSISESVEIEVPTGPPGSELHAHVPLLLASCAPCDGPDGLPTGNGSAGTTVAESASAAARMAADFIRRFSPYYLRHRLLANAAIAASRRPMRASEIAALGCISSLPEWGNFIRAISGQLVLPGK